jgi:hypothetical protein
METMRRGTRAVGMVVIRGGDAAEGIGGDACGDGGAGGLGLGDLRVWRRFFLGVWMMELGEVEELEVRVGDSSGSAAVLCRGGRLCWCVARLGLCLVWIGEAFSFCAIDLRSITEYGVQSICLEEYQVEGNIPKEVRSRKNMYDPFNVKGADV